MLQRMQPTCTTGLPASAFVPCLVPFIAEPQTSTSTFTLQLPEPLSAQMSYRLRGVFRLLYLSTTCLYRNQSVTPFQEGSSSGRTLNEE